MTTSVHAVVGLSWDDLDGEQREDYAWNLREILSYGERFLLLPDESAAFASATPEQCAEAMRRTLQANSPICIKGKGGK